MRNKIILAMAAAGMMCATSAFATTIPTTDAGNGTINFTGSVIDAPCSIAPDSRNINVDLGQVTKKSLASTGSTSDLVPVTINLTGCSFDDGQGGTGGSTTAISKVGVEFSTSAGSNSNTDSKGEITNTATSNPATNVAVQLLKGDGVNPVNLNTAPTTNDATSLVTDSATNKLNFYAHMIATGTGVTPGNVSAQVTYKLKYF
ncbi:TPA: fimbrial protein [Salmonella enterica]|nr:long polar fimbrial protein LpfA [Salmonella enterica subsp. diarizonae]